MEIPRAAEICTRDVAVIPADATPVDAARAMERAGVGCLVVTDAQARAVGIVTDRDLALRVVAPSIDPGTLLVRDVMTSPLASVRAEDSVDEVFERMRRSGIRRVAVLDGADLVGIVAMDDLLQSLARELDDLGKETASQVGGARWRGLDRSQRDIDHRLHGISRRLQLTSWITREALLEEIEELRARVREAKD